MCSGMQHAYSYIYIYIYNIYLTHGSALQAGGDNTYRLKLILYYDEVEVVNALGYAAGKHKLGLFYWALIDMPPHLRMALHNIQLATICLDKDMQYYGAKQIISGPPGEPYSQGTSIGAALERLDGGREIYILVGRTFEPRTFHAWAVCFAADFPAAAKCSGYMVSASAHLFCRAPPAYTQCNTRCYTGLLV